MRPATLHQCLKFDAIRLSGYGVIAEKPSVGHLPRFFSVHFVEKLRFGSK